jgi:signal peptidase II
LGNIIDSTFYGLIFSASSPFQKALLFPAEGGYAPFLHGAVVDMFYFPLWEGRLPEWLPVWGGEHFLFFRPVFNIADAAITSGVVLFILVQRPERTDATVGTSTTEQEEADVATSDVAEGSAESENRPDQATA